MLTYADVCWRMQARGEATPLTLGMFENRLTGAQFTCFTRTKVQILTPEELRARTFGSACRALGRGAAVCVCVCVCVFVSVCVGVCVCVCVCVCVFSCGC